MEHFIEHWGSIFHHSDHIDANSTSAGDVVGANETTSAATNGAAVGGLHPWVWQNLHSSSTGTGQVDPALATSLQA